MVTKEDRTKLIASVRTGDARRRIHHPVLYLHLAQRARPSAPHTARTTDLSSFTCPVTALRGHCFSSFYPTSAPTTTTMPLSSSPSCLSLPTRSSCSRLYLAQVSISTSTTSATHSPELPPRPPSLLCDFSLMLAIFIGSPIHISGATPCGDRHQHYASDMNSAIHSLLLWYLRP